MPVLGEGIILTRDGLEIGAETGTCHLPPDARAGRGRSGEDAWLAVDPLP
jgi:hypothetical protein